MLKLQLLKKNKEKEKEKKDEIKEKKKQKKVKKEYAISEEAIKKKPKKAKDKTNTKAKSVKAKTTPRPPKPSKPSKQREPPRSSPLPHSPLPSHLPLRHNYDDMDEGEEEEEEFQYAMTEQPVSLSSPSPLLSLSPNVLYSDGEDSAEEEDGDSDGDEDEHNPSLPLPSPHFPPRRSSRPLPPPSLSADPSLTPLCPSPPAPRIQWQMGGLLGAGSYGQVRMGLNTANGELIAVKQVPIPDDFSPLHPTHDRKEDDVAILQKEIEILRPLRHDNIVRYLGTSIEHNMLNIFLEYVPGGSLHSLLQKMGPFPEEIISKYSKQILLGLQYLHHHNIIHRDIKGANILVDARGIIKLADFGASKKIEGVVSSLSGQSSLKGTPYWMAPEIARQQPVTCKADIWSMACTIVEMATGKPPFSEFADQVSVLFHIATLKSRPKFSLPLSPIALNFLKKCFHLEAEKRWSAKELLAHPFITNKNGVSLSSPDYRQAGIIPDDPPRLHDHPHSHSTKFPYSDSLFPIHKHPNPHLSSGSRGYSQPVASPFMYLRKSDALLDSSQPPRTSLKYQHNNNNNYEKNEKKAANNNNHKRQTSNNSEKTHTRRLSDLPKKKF